MQPFLLHSRKDVLAVSVKQAVIQTPLLTYICLYVSFGRADFMLYMPTFKVCEELGTLCEQNLPGTYFLTTFHPVFRLSCAAVQAGCNTKGIRGQLYLHCEGWVGCFWFGSPLAGLLGLHQKREGRPLGSLNANPLK